MCGIAGTVGLCGPSLAETMVATLRHRGPDGTGIWTAGATTLATARLSIIDPAAGARPITNETGDVAIAFNGEIYNHRDLRAELRSRGHRFRTNTDTEVVVHLYEELGPDCVHRLRGMFAFAIADGDRLFLARDRLGIKPLHYALTPDAGVFMFASEIKAILQCRAFRPRLDIQALADSVVLGYAAGSRTYIEGIDSLEAGHTMYVVWEEGKASAKAPRGYFSTGDRDDSLEFEEAKAALEDALEDSVEGHLAADVDVGLTLSGGLDSTLLTLLAHQREADPHTLYTLADHPDHPDVVASRQVAKLVRWPHEIRVLEYDDYLDAIPAFVAAEEQPSSLFGLPFFLLCQDISNDMKVCIHGEGADELFGGYREYLDRSHRTAAIARRLPLLKQLGVAPSTQATATIERLADAASFDSYLDAIFDVNLGDALERLHLDVVDKSSMASGVEIRVPYLDDRVYELVTQVPLRHLVKVDLGIRKYILRRLCLERYGSDLTDVVLREKLGVPSATIHHLTRFNAFCNETLPETYLERHPLGFCFATKRELVLFEMFIDIFIVHRGDTRAIPPVLEYVRARAACSTPADGLVAVG